MKTMQILTDITGMLVQVNVATPIISGTIMAIASIIKGVTGSGPTLGEIADMLETQIGRNETAIRAEIARLEAKSE